jgi:hypothetical protein
LSPKPEASASAAEKRAWDCLEIITIGLAQRKKVAPPAGPVQHISKAPENRSWGYS